MKLKPCPFCGGDVDLRETGSFTGVGADYEVCHLDDTVCIADEMYLGSGTEAQQVARWNVRAVNKNKPLSLGEPGTFTNNSQASVFLNGQEIKSGETKILIRPDHSHLWNRRFDGIEFCATCGVRKE